MHFVIVLQQTFMRETFKYILIVIGGAILAIWGFVTAIVLVGSIHRWSNPGQKSISNLDLKEYMEFSFWVIGFVAILFLLHRFFSYRQKKTSS